MNEVISIIIKIVMVIVSILTMDISHEIEDDNQGNKINLFPCADSFYEAYSRPYIAHKWDCSNMSLMYYECLKSEGYNAKIIVVQKKPLDSTNNNYVHSMIEIDFGGTIGKRYYDPSSGEYNMTTYKNDWNFYTYEDEQTIECSWEYKNNKSNPICEGFTKEYKWRYDVDVEGGINNE